MALTKFGAGDARRPAREPAGLLLRRRGRGLRREGARERSSTSNTAWSRRWTVCPSRSSTATAPVHPRRHARRWARGRGRDGESAHDPVHSHGAAGEAAAPHRARRGLHGEKRSLPRSMPSARRTGSRPLPIPATPPPARCASLTRGSRRSAGWILPFSTPPARRGTDFRPTPRRLLICARRNSRSSATRWSTTCRTRLRRSGRLGEERAELPYDMDGAVVKLNSLTDREILGSTSKVPRWAIAYKYPPERRRPA